VSWKIADDIVQHIDIKEEGKENAFSLGSSLWIGGEVSSYPFLWLSLKSVSIVTQQHHRFAKMADVGCFFKEYIAVIWLLSKISLYLEINCMDTRWII